MRVPGWSSALNPRQRNRNGGLVELMPVMCNSGSCIQASVPTHTMVVISGCQGLLSTSCWGHLHPSPTSCLSAHSQAQRRCLVLRDASQQTLENPEDAARTPVQVGKASQGWVLMESTECGFAKSTAGVPWHRGESQAWSCPRMGSRAPFPSRDPGPAAPPRLLLVNE